MKTITTVKSWPAITLGGLFAAGTAYVMFSDVRSLADFTFDHTTTALILIGTVAAGHMIWPRLKSWRTWLQALGLAVLFATGTWYCVTSSAGRNAEATAAKVSAVDVANAERARLARALVDAAEAHRKARDAETAECASGAGKKCLAARETTAKRKSEAADAELAFRKAPHEKVANGGTKHAAQVFALMLPASPASIEHAIGLLMPFAKALFLEIATLIFLGIGLGHRKVTISESVQTSFSADDFQKAKEMLVGPLPEIDPPTGGGKPRRKVTEGKSNVVVFQPAERKHEVVALLEKVGSVGSNRELAEMLGCSEGEAKKRRTEVADLLEEGWDCRRRTIKLKRA